MKNNTLESLKNGGFNAAIASLYSAEECEFQKIRLIKLAELFISLYGERDGMRFFSAPGRTEVCGNHTDHNRGEVLAAAINLDAVACAAANGENTVRVKSAEYPDTDIIDLTQLSPVEAEKNTSAALIRGVAARLSQLGYKIGGFDAATVTRVLSGSGLSSSAAFEVLIGSVFNYLFNDGAISPVVIAQTAQYAENKFFGKPCGLMDQTACSVGSFVRIDFADTDKPVITPLEFDFASCGHDLIITDTRASHADLTDEYASIRLEMEAVAGFFGKPALRDVDECEFYKNIAAIREKTGERPLLRAFHFFSENKRVEAAADALNKNDFEAFKTVIKDSGASSFMYNQNVFSSKFPLSQPVSLALAASQAVLCSRGAWRVHGGGFAGTIQAFVPHELKDKYVSALENIFGSGACYVLSIRARGGTEIK